MKNINIEFTNGNIVVMPINWGWFEQELAYWESPNRKNVVRVWVS